MNCTGRIGACDQSSIIGTFTVYVTPYIKHGLMCQVCVGGSDRNVSELIHLDSNLTSIDPKL